MLSLLSALSPGQLSTRNPFWLSPIQFAQAQQALITAKSLPNSLETVATRTTPNEMQRLQPEWGQLLEKCQMISILCRSFQPVLANQTSQAASDIINYGTFACTTYQSLKSVIQAWQANDLTAQDAQTQIRELIQPLLNQLTTFSQASTELKRRITYFLDRLFQHQRDAQFSLARYKNKAAQSSPKLYSTVYSLVTTSLDQIFNTLNQALPIVEKQEGTWNAIAADLTNLLKVSDQDLPQLEITEFAIDEAIQAWASLIQIATQAKI